MVWSKRTAIYCETANSTQCFRGNPEASHCSAESICWEVSVCFHENRLADIGKGNMQYFLYRTPCSEILNDFEGTYYRSAVWQHVLVVKSCMEFKKKRIWSEEIQFIPRTPFIGV